MEMPPANPLFGLVGIPYVLIRVKNKKKEPDAYRFLKESGYILAELVDNRYAVKPEALDELKAKRIGYEALLHYPMSKEVRERVRANMKKKGTMGPV